MSAADVAALFHDPLGRTQFDAEHTGVSEWRVDCGCGHQSWGPTQDAAECGHRRHRQERAEALALAMSMMRAAVAVEHENTEADT